ncbi:MAG: hypothetical protein F4086_10135 [Gemmatimonadetes bacterium]|nr:hypothetical protein [Gemmatimonadota bacterium]
MAVSFDDHDLGIHQVTGQQEVERWFGAGLPAPHHGEFIRAGQQHALRAALVAVAPRIRAGRVQAEVVTVLDGHHPASAARQLGDHRDRQRRLARVLVADDRECGRRQILRPVDAAEAGGSHARVHHHRVQRLRERPGLAMAAP